MLTSSAKAKGRALQNRVAKDLATLTGLTYGRPDDESADLRGRLMGTPGSDLVRRWDPTVLASVPFYVECKAREVWSFGPRTLDGGSAPLIQWYIETARKALLEKRQEVSIPLLVAHRNNYPTVAVLGNQWVGLAFSSLVLPISWEGPSSHVTVMRWGDFLSWWYGSFDRTKSSG